LAIASCDPPDERERDVEIVFVADRLVNVLYAERRGIAWG